MHIIYISKLIIEWFKKTFQVTSAVNITVSNNKNSSKKLPPLGQAQQLTQGVSHFSIYQHVEKNNVQKVTILVFQYLHENDNFLSVIYGNKITIFLPVEKL